MNLFFDLIGIVCLLLYLYMLKKNTLVSITWAFFIITLGKGVGFLSISETLLKVMVLLPIFLSIAKGDYEKRQLQTVICGGIAMLFFVLIPLDTSVEFLVKLRSYMTLITGLLLFALKWKNSDIIDSLKILSIAPIVNVLLGVIYYRRLISSINRIICINITAYVVILAFFAIYASYRLIMLFHSRKYFILIIINTGIALGTMQRMGTLVVLLLLIGIAVTNGRYVKRSVMIGILVSLPFVMIIADIALSNLISRTFSTAYMETASINTSGRSFLWAKLWETRYGYEWLGHGLGYINTLNFAYWTETGTMAAHNEFLRFILETGYVGCVFLIFIFGTLIRRGIKLFSKKKDITKYLLLSFLILSITDNTVSAAIIFYGFAILFSISFSINRYSFLEMDYENK